MLHLRTWRAAAVAAGAVALVAAGSGLAASARTDPVDKAGAAGTPAFAAGDCPFALPAGLNAGRNAASEGATGKDAAGKDGSGKDGSGKDGSGKDGSGKDGSGKDGSGKDGSGKDAAGEDGSGKDAPGKGAEGQGGAGPNVECGTVAVPLNRAATDAPASARLATIVLRAGTARTEEAVFHMIGGPGGSAEAFATVLPKFAALARDTGRDVVFVDQRGTGHSTPFLDCDAEFTAAQTSGEDPRPACKKRLAEEGVDPADFTPAAIVDDIEDVRRALAYGKVDVWGQSAGSYLAQEFARRHPASVRSLLLESVDGGPTSLGRPAGFNAALDRMISACERQRACAARNPSLDRRLSEAFTRLNAKPLPTAAGPLDGASLIAVVEQTLEFADGTVTTADLITAAHRRDKKTVEATLAKLAAGPQITGPFSAVMNELVNCAQTQRYATAASVAAANAGIRPEIDTAGVLAQYVTTCASWGVTFPDDAAGVPVPNTVPTLVINGDVDPNTALDYARQVAAYARTVEVVSFAGFGHLIAAGGDSCGLAVYASFLRAPDKPVNRACVPTTATFRAAKG